MTASAIYDATIRHRRSEPSHTVRHRLRLAYLDLDELPGVVERRRGWSTGAAPVQFRRSDYLDGSDRPLRDALDDLVTARTGRGVAGPVRMLTQLRTLGWLFNPLTTYYLFAADGHALDRVVLEVSNTPWHERSWYVLDAAQVTGRGTPFAKDFHVSPFLPMGLTYRCRLPAPGDRLAVRFELSATDVDGLERRVFDADLTGRRLPIDARPTARRALAAAGQTLGVSLGIYAHAAALRSRGATFHRHPSRSATPAPLHGRAALDTRSPS